MVVGDNEVRFDYKEKAYVLDYVKVRGSIDTIILLPLNKSSPLIYSFHRFLKEHTSDDRGMFQDTRALGTITLPMKGINYSIYSNKYPPL